MIQEGKLAEGRLSLQVAGPFEFLDPFERSGAELEEQNGELSTSLDVPVVKLGYRHDSCYLFFLLCFA